jgi:hypothetical protein
MVMVKLPVSVSLQPVGVPPPVNVQSPVTDPLVSVIVLLPVCPVSDATPTSGPVTVRVLPPDCIVYAKVPVTARVV